MSYECSLLFLFRVSVACFVLVSFGMISFLKPLVFQQLVLSRFSPFSVIVFLKIFISIFLRVSGSFHASVL